MASKGLANSGTCLAELTKYGQGLAGQQYFNQANLLSKLAGLMPRRRVPQRGPLRPFPTSKTTRLSGPNCGNPGEANQQQALGVAKLGNLLKPYYAYAGAQHGIHGQ